MSKTLIEITNELRDLMFQRDEMIQAGLEVTGELNEKINEIMEFQGNKIDRCVSFVQMAENQITWLKTEKEHLAKQIKKYERAVDGMKDIAKNVMEQNGITEMVGENGHKFRLSHNTRVNVLSLDQIPQELTREKISIEPDKNAIKEKLKAGEKVPGAELIESTSVVVK